MLQEKVPFNERGGKLRGVLDAVSGRFPGFVFGGGVGRDTLPVFHFHDETRADLEPKLRYLAENGYRTVTSEDVAKFIESPSSSDGRLVALCFDDAWASVWTVAAPLLRQYGLTAIVYAIPWRVEEAMECRPIANDGSDGEGSRFVTWPELRALHSSGFVDVQSHTMTHSRVFCSSQIDGFVTPDYASTPLLNRPRVSAALSAGFLTPRDLGAPLYMARSRMSDARQVVFDPGVQLRCVDHVARHGGAEFFGRSGWREELESLARDAEPRVESEDDQQAAIETELDRSRAVLNDRLRTTTVNHVCLPWGVSGTCTADVLRRLGFRTAFANRLRGIHAVKRGDDRFWLKRLPNKYITRLPGRGRWTWL